jgi:predicted nucleic acid-binding protein
MSRVSLERSLPAGGRLLLDTSALIAYLDGSENVSPAATHVIDVLVRSGRNQALVSVVTAMEVLVRPLRRGPTEPYRHTFDFLTLFPNLRSLVVDLPVAQEAASLRAAYNLSAADALIIASGLVSQVGHLITNDQSWQRKLRPMGRRIAVCYLADHLPFP